MASINEAVQEIKRLGASNARVVPCDESPGRSQIEVRENGQWRVLEATKGLSQRMAEDLIQQASNRVILG